MKEGYLTIANEATHEIIINKSRFIGYACTVETEEEVQNKLEEIRMIYPNATHYCYGYILGLSGNHKRFSDDGEPSGTAGMPILQVIEKNGLVNALVIVTRYFGGIKLGAGGLVRAYSKTAAETITVGKIANMELGSKGIIKFDYSLLGSVEHFLKNSGIPIENTEYSDIVEMTLVVKGSWDDFCKGLNNRFNANISTAKVDDIYYNWA